MIKTNHRKAPTNKDNINIVQGKAKPERIPNWYALRLFHVREFGWFVRFPRPYFMQRYRNVTICALVQFASGEKVVAVEPLVMFPSTAHSTASA